METTPKAAALQSVCSTPCSPVESSPYEAKEEKCNQTLSASLKERLKRSRRSFTSPFVSVAKRLCVDEEEEKEDGDQQETVDGPPQPQDMQHVDVNRNVVRSASERVPEPAQPPSVDLLRVQLTQEVRQKQETLRRLKLVQMYRSKNDLSQLQILVDKWRSCVQEALYELQTELPVDGRKASLSQLIDHFGLDDSLLHFDRAEEDFIT